MKHKDRHLVNNLSKNKNLHLNLMLKLRDLNIKSSSLILFCIDKLLKNKIYKIKRSFYKKRIKKLKSRQDIRPIKLINFKPH